MKALRIQELRAFLAICKHGSFTKAAEATFTTQPTISWQLSQLEKELGKQLFIRGKGLRQLTLTDAGQIFLRQAEKLDQLWSETESLLDTEQLELYSFNCNPSLADLLLPKMHRAFRQNHPGCTLFLDSQPSFVSAPNVESGVLDAAIVCDFEPSTRMQTINFAREPAHFVCRNEAPYGDYVCVENLRREDQVYVRWTLDMQAWEREHFNITQIPYARINSLRNIDAYFTDIKNWAIIPHSAYINMPQDQFRICELDYPPNPRSFHLVTHYPPRQPYFDTVKEVVREAFRNIEGMQIIAEDF